MNRSELGPREFSRATAGKGLVATGRVREASPVLAEGVERFIFADVFSRSGLGAREREMLTCAVLAAIGGADNQLGVHVPAAIECGADPDELIQLCEQITPYCGFPRALNALRAVRAVLDERGLPLPLSTREVRLPDGEGTLVTTTGEGDTGYLLIHTPELDRQAWREVIRALPEGTRCVAPDLRGAGAAGSATPAVGIDQLVDDAIAVLDAEGMARAVVVTMGGAAALGRALATRGDRVSRHVECCAAVPSSEPPSVDLLTTWFAAPELAADGWAVRYARDRVRRIDPGGYRGLAAALAAGGGDGERCAGHPLSDPATCAATIVAAAP